MSEKINREIRLKNRPTGLPAESDFELAETPLPEPGPGQVLVRNIYMSVDPYMRGRLMERPTYGQRFEIGQPLYGGCVGQVVQSNGAGLQVGDYVLGGLGWREYYAADGTEVTKIEPKIAPLPAFLGTVGMPGQTAYVGLLDIGQPKAGETVFVSAASGAVGSIVCQIAKIKGCRVVGSAGSDEKVAWLTDEAGVDAAFNYKKVADLTTELGRHCPDGVDVYFENVGGEHLEAALERMNLYGRVVMCGMIAHYNQKLPGPTNLAHGVRKRLTLKGFIISDHQDRLPDFYADMGQWIEAGRIKWKETIVEGLEKAPGAFIGLFKGENFGKMVVKIGPDPAV